MNNPFQFFKLGKPRRVGAWLIAALTLLAGGLPARAQSLVTINAPSLMQLTSALNFSSTTTTQTVMCAFNGTITLTGPLTIAGNIILEATTNFNVTIQGVHGQRIFKVQPGVNFLMQNLILSGGDSAGTNGANGFTVVGSGNKPITGNPGTSGAGGFGGAIYNLGTNIDINCIFLTNTASGGNGGAGGTGVIGSDGQGANGGSGGSGGNAFGGAICNLGTILLSNCTFAGNGTIAGNGGVGGTNTSGFSAYPGAGGSGGTAAGAALYNLGRANIQNCTFDFNFCEGGTSQTAGGMPGGNGNGPMGAVGGSGEGAGIYNMASNPVVNSMVVLNSTFAGNLAVGGNGGNGGEGTQKTGAGGNGGNAIGAGLFNDAGGTIAITNCTFANGSVFSGTNGLIGTVGSTVGVSPGMLGIEGGASIANTGTTLLLRNSIMAYGTNGGNVYGNITDQGFNISDDDTPLTGKMATTMTNLDPLLAQPLSSNGGPTLTFDLQAGSPAIDAITGTNVGVDFPALDQRGFPRPLPIGGFADIGAVEHGNPAYTISGKLFPSGTNAFVLNEYTNVVITATGSGVTYSTMPDSMGRFAFTTLPPDIYLVVPQPTNGFSFSPQNDTVTLAITNQISTTNDFAATPSFMLGGIISNLTATITVNLFATNNGNNVPIAQTVTASTGVYTFTNIPNGNYLIVPQQTSTIGFTPLSLLTTNFNANNTNYNFIAGVPTYQVSGSIADLNGTIVTVQAVSTVSSSVQTDGNGNYTLNLVQGSYTVTPQASNGITFSPTSQFVTVPPSTNLMVFTAQGAFSIGNFSLSGLVTNLHTSIMMTAVSSGATQSTPTDTNGNYAFASLPSGSYTVTPQAMTGVSYSPGSVPVSLSANTTANIIVAMPTNPSLLITHQPNSLTANLSYAKWVPYFSYRIQTSTNTKVWQDVFTNIAGTTSPTDTVAVSSLTNRFFRAVSP